MNGIRLIQIHHSVAERSGLENGGEVIVVKSSRRM
jgi:hypothetical protein